jgi:hypothetical protein
MSEPTRHGSHTPRGEAPGVPGSIRPGGGPEARGGASPGVLFDLALLRQRRMMAEYRAALLRRLFTGCLLLAAMNRSVHPATKPGEVVGVASDFRYVGLDSGAERSVRFKVESGGVTRDYRAFTDARINIPGRKRAPIHEVYIWGLTEDRPRVKLRATDRRVYEATFTSMQGGRRGQE